MAGKDNRGQARRLRQGFDLVAETIQQRYDDAPPIVQAAVRAILDLEDRIDPMGYDLSYYQEDLPKVVVNAIASWKRYG